MAVTGLMRVLMVQEVGYAKLRECGPERAGNRGCQSALEVRPVEVCSKRSCSMSEAEPSSERDDFLIKLQRELHASVFLIKRTRKELARTRRRGGRHAGIDGHDRMECA